MGVSDAELPAVDAPREFFLSEICMRQRVGRSGHTTRYVLVSGSMICSAASRDTLSCCVATLAIGTRAVPVPETIQQGKMVHVQSIRVDEEKNFFVSVNPGLRKIAAVLVPQNEEEGDAGLSGTQMKLLKISAARYYPESDTMGATRHASERNDRVRALLDALCTLASRWNSFVWLVERAHERSNVSCGRLVAGLYERAIGSTTGSIVRR